jgi:predicted signal transduction protein with EAL and GGDEF domain
VILMDELDEPATAALLAERLCERISQPFEVGGQVLRLTASIGVSLFPNDGDNMESLLSNADLAMYRAKDHGRNTYRFFEPQMSAQASRRLQLETALRGAVGNDELRLVYQPQIRLEDNRMHGAEALLRWTHPQLGEVSPAIFIPLAEEIGVISELGRWVLEQACRQTAEWDRAGLLLPRLSVNVSVQQLERGDFVDEIRSLFEATSVEPDRLELEVTETVLMRNVERVTANLSALKDLGVTLAVDDFGSGFSSLSYLKQLPITRLKIDKAFVDGITLDSNDDAIARAIIALGRALSLETIAEGVETAPQAEFLASEGCDEVQGYLFGRPMTPAALCEKHATNIANTASD